MRFAATLLIFVATSVAGCGRNIPEVLQPKLSKVSPQEFTADPLQRRLAIAVDRGDEAEVAAAVAAGADVNARSKGGFCLLIWALVRKNPKGFEALLAHGANIEADCRDPSKLPDPRLREPVLDYALGCLDPRFLEAALRQGLDPNHIPYPESRSTILFTAIRRHSVPAIKALIAAGADINHQDSDGYTPLVEAWMRLAYNQAWVLLEHGADPTIPDEMGHDFVWGLKQYGSAGVFPDHRESFEKIVAELIRRGLLTRQDIIDADKPKPSAIGGPPGVTVIQHSPYSEAGQAILRLDQSEREANQRQAR